MRINVETTTTKRIFDLKAGDTFLYKTRYYIKTDDCSRYEDGTAVCVELEYGVTERIINCTEVVPVSLTVIETPRPEG